MENLKGMDLLHRCNEFQFISEEISIREFFENATKSLTDVQKYGAQPSEAMDIASSLHCQPQVVEEIRRICDVEHLKCGEEEDLDALLAEIPSSSTLLTTDIQRQELEKRNVLCYRQMQGQMQKYKRFNFKILDSFRDDHLNFADFKSPDVLLTIFFAKPYNKPLHQHEIRLGRLLTMDNVFYVLGRQHLTELRDRLNCLADWGALHDFSENPKQEQEVLTQEKYKSAFFYINGTFYNDLRDPNAKDLSQNVIDWAAKRSREIGAMKKADMNATTFLDLSIRLGQPYLYLHQGTCEHLFMVTDIRLLHPTDCLDASKYPLQVSYKMKKRAACCICKIYTARWITYNHEMLPFDPGFFCDDCFFAYNYDRKNRKICAFYAIPYFDRSVL